METPGMAGKKQYSVRLPDDVSRAVEQKAEQENIKHSDALRRACTYYFLGDREVMNQLEEVEHQQRKHYRDLRRRTLAGAVAVLYLALTIAIQPVASTLGSALWILLGVSLLVGTVAAVQRRGPFA